MRLSEHKDLKIEILALPTKEKDKLLLRLVAKDKVLTERFHFLLIEDENSLRERTVSLKEEIVQEEQNLRLLKSKSAKDILINLRKLTKSINHFLKVTKANFEEVELRIFLFNHTPFEFKSKIFSSYKNYDQLFAIYFIKSVLATLKKFEKLHEDLQFDLREDLNSLLSNIFNENMGALAFEMGLPKQV